MSEIADIESAPAARHPIRIVVADDLRRSRLTVFFRLLLALPHLVWVVLWAVAAVVVALVTWFATLARGTAPAALHEFLARFVRYTIHLEAYLYLVANPFPGFAGTPGSYPVDVEIDPPRRQNRWTVGFRILLAVPAMILASALGGSFGGSWRSGGGIGGAGLSVGVLATVAFLGWFVSLVVARMPQGLRDLGAYALGYTAQANAYLFLLTDRYPSSDPAVVGATAPGPLPVSLSLGDDLRRSRLTVFFRLLLALPHIVWLLLWSIAAYVAAFVNWLAALVSGSSPPALHDFLAAYVRYQTHVYAYLYLVGNPFPGFAGTAGSYPVDATIDPPARQNRWLTGFRIFLVVPALIVSSALSSAAGAGAFLGWFACLVTGRMPVGLRNLGAYYLRYNAHVLAYGLVLTDRYPYSGPVLAG